MLNAFALLSLMSIIICTILAVIVYFKEVRYVFFNKTGKLFVLLCLSLAFFWALIEFGYRFSGDFNTAYSWLKLNVLWYIVMSFLLHLSLVYTEHKHLLKKKITHLLIYGPALAFFLIDISTNLLVTEPIKESWGWTFGIPTNPIVHSISSTWAAFMALFCLYIFLDYSTKTYSTIRKKQTKYLAIGICIPVVIGLNTEWIFPILGIRFPELLVPALTSGLIIIWYGIWVYSPDKNKNRYSFVKNEVDKIIKSFG